MQYSKLVKMRIVNIGCIGPEGIEIKMDKILTIVGQNVQVQHLLEKVLV